MAVLVLKSMSDRQEASIIEPLRNRGEPVDRIRLMRTNVDKLYSTGKQSSLLTVLALGEAKNLFHKKIRNTFNVWIDTLVQVLIQTVIECSQAQQRSEDAMVANSRFSETSLEFR